MFLIIVPELITPFLSWCNENEFSYKKLPNDTEDFPTNPHHDILYAKYWRAYYIPGALPVDEYEYQACLYSVEAKMLAKLTFTLPDTDLDTMWLPVDSFS